MPPAPEQLPFPADPSQIADPGVIDGLSASELGAVIRLARAAWFAQNPCTLPADDSFLAMVARITSEEFAASKARILLALCATPGLRGETYLFGAARRAFDAANSAATQTAERRRLQTASATQAAAEKRRSRPTIDSPSRTRDGSVTEPLRSTARSSLDSSALSLNRSQPQSANQSAQSARDVIAVMGERARAIVPELADRWRREHALAMLQRAFADWAARGLTNAPIRKASELAESKNADPARVEWLIEDANAKIVLGQKMKKPCNPVGVLIHGLGESEKNGFKPCDVPIFVSERWAKRKADALKLLEAQASLHAKQRQIGEAQAREAKRPG